MQDYIQFPKNINQLSELHSSNLEDLRNNSHMVDNRISLDYLRKLYGQDRNRFLSVKDELSLRGFKFHTEKPNSLLPNYSPKMSSYIVAESHSERYQQVDFSLFGLSGFIQRFHVDSDLFFHKIPLRGFKLLNANLDVSSLETEFKKAGFDIDSLDGNRSSQTAVIPAASVSEDKTSEGKAIEEDAVLFKIEQFFLHTPIHIVFHSKKFNSFLNFCELKGLKKLIDLTGEAIKEFEDSYKKKTDYVQEVKEMVSEITLSSLIELREKFPSIHLQSDSSLANEAGTHRVNGVFAENKYKRFLSFCHTESILTIGEIKQSHIQSFSTASGVGFKKVRDVFDGLQAIIQKNTYGESISENLDSERSISIVFKENKFNTFRRFCYKNDIQTIEGITNEQLDAYAVEKGVGAGRVEIVKEKLQEYNALPSKPEVFAGLGYEITDLFADSKMVAFRKFCEKKGIKRMNELTAEQLEEFSKTPGVGKKKFEDIKKILTKNLWGKEIPKVIEFKDCELYEEFKEYRVKNLIDVFQIEGNQTDSLLTLEEIDGMEINELENHFDAGVIFALNKKLKMAKHPSSVVEGLQSGLKGNQYRILQLRYGDKLTLEATGEHFHVTRERIRQIAKKALNKVHWQLGHYYFYKVTSLLSSSHSFITAKELLSLIGEENKFLIEILKESTEKLTYYEKLDAFFFSIDKKIDFSKMDQFIEDLPNVIHLSEYESALEELLESLGVEQPEQPLIQSLLMNYGFRSYGEYYSSRRMSLIEVLETIYRDFLSGPLLIDEAGYETIQKLAKRHLNYDISGTVRSIEARLRDSDKVILVESNTFQWFDDESFDHSLIQEIEKYLEERFEDTDVVNIGEVFNEFKDRIEHLGIYTKQHLYSIVRYYLDEKVDIGKGNTLNIFKSDANKLSIEESLLKVLKEVGGFSDKSVLKEKLRWQQYKVDLGISGSNKIVNWGKNKVILFEKIGLTSTEIELLIMTAEKKLSLDGYVTAGSLLNDFKFNPKLAPLISKKGIDDIGKLASVLKILLPELKGFMNFLYLEGSKFTSFEEVMIDRFDGETTRKELQDFAVSNGYKEVMASNILKKLLDQKLFVEVDLGKLYPASKLEVSEAVVSELVQFVEEARDGKEYISLHSLKGYKRRLPHIGFRWNPFLMKTILVENGYRHITKIIRDYRYDKIVLVKENSSIGSFEELVHFVLKHEYSGNMHERSVYDFLVEKGILREQDSPSGKVLPHELKNVDNLVNVDELGIVSLKQGL
jgi:hypothetical protein